MKNTLTNHTKHVPSKRTFNYISPSFPSTSSYLDSRIELDNSSEDEGGNWHHIAPNPSRKSSLEPKNITHQMRAILEQLVLVTDFPPELVNNEIVSRSCYFGRYGKVHKSIFSKGIYHNKKSHLAFITYENQLDAAMAIVVLIGQIQAMQSFEHLDYRCTTTYGTSKFCPSMLKNIECTFDNCHYVHTRDIAHKTVNEMRKMTHNQKIKPAIDKIRDNLQYFLEKEYQQFLAAKDKPKNNGLVSCWCVNENAGELIAMPTVKDTLAKLIQQNQIDSEQYARMKNQYKMKIKEKKERSHSKSQRSSGSWLVMKSEVEMQNKNDESTSNVSNQDQSEKQVFYTPMKFQSDEAEAQFQQEKNQEKKEVPKQQNIPYILQRYLNLELQNTKEEKPLERYYKSRQIQLKKQQSKGRQTLKMYQKLMNPERALSTYIHHKILQQANWTPPHSLLTSIPQSQVECSSFRRIVYRHLVQY